MLIPTLIMAAIALGLFLLATAEGRGQNISGLKAGFRMLVEILPLLVFAFIIAGMVQVLLPRDLLSKWVGEQSGLKGIMIGVLAGAITPGGPYVSLPMEIGILGWRFTLVRLASVIVFPPLAGVLANYVRSRIAPMRDIPTS